MDFSAHSGDPHHSPWLRCSHGSRTSQTHQVCRCALWNFATKPQCHGNHEVAGSVQQDRGLKLRCLLLGGSWEQCRRRHGLVWKRARCLLVTISLLWLRYRTNATLCKSSSACGKDKQKSREQRLSYRKSCPGRYSPRPRRALQRRGARCTAVYHSSSRTRPRPKAYFSFQWTGFSFCCHLPSEKVQEFTQLCAWRAPVCYQRAFTHRDLQRKNSSLPVNRIH